ncbi:MAG: ATP-dependent zinc protease family protein [Aeromonas sp.]
MMHKAAQLALGLLLAGSCSVVLAQASEAPETYGWIEKGLILPYPNARNPQKQAVTVKMKLDTGALSSSLDARQIKLFRRDGKRWARFWLTVKDANTGDEVKHQLELPVKRLVTVRGAGGKDRRPVVRMSFCLGDKQLQDWFTLRDRGEMLYPVLIGRNVLKTLGPVDAGATFTRQPSCR